MSNLVHKGTVEVLGAPTRELVAQPVDARRASRERLCAACGQVESAHLLPQHIRWAREREARGEGTVYVVQGVNLQGSKCYSCGGGECLGHPWHHFVFLEGGPV